MIKRIRKHISDMHSLNTKMLITVIVGLVCALIAFFAMYFGGRAIVNRFYMSAETESARKASIYSKFNLFVKDNKIKGTDSAEIAEWTESNRYVSIFVYDNSGIRFKAQGGTATNGSNLISSDILKYSEQYGKLYPIRFADGNYKIAILDTSQNREYTICLAIAIIMAFLVFMLALFIYVGNLTQRIITLSESAAVIGAGVLDAPIYSDGSDELSDMAADFDSMRNAVIEKMGNEQRAWQANSDLITAISHDMRTPMTALIGYLGLLSESDFNSPERDRAFTASAYNKAIELKELTDELFRYFLVFGKADVKLDLEPFDAWLLLEQLFGEAEFELSENGFTIERSDYTGDAVIMADALYIKRVMDNFVSNIKKYADRAQPVGFSSWVCDGRITVRVTNTIAEIANRPESNKIGLRTCGKIMELMGGSFSAHPEDGLFISEFSLPVSSVQGA